MEATDDSGKAGDGDIVPDPEGIITVATTTQVAGEN
jgi:hypothetical protein